MILRDGKFSSSKSEIRNAPVVALDDILVLSVDAVYDDVEPLATIAGVDDGTDGDDDAIQGNKEILSSQTWYTPGPDGAPLSNPRSTIQELERLAVDGRKELWVIVVKVPTQDIR